jgi:hypothetical protein
MKNLLRANLSVLNMPDVISDYHIAVSFAIKYLPNDAVSRSVVSSLLVTAIIPKVKNFFFTVVMLFYMLQITPAKVAYFSKIRHCASFCRSN